MRYWTHLNKSTFSYIKLKKKRFKLKTKRMIIRIDSRNNISLSTWMTTASGKKKTFGNLFFKKCWIKSFKKPFKRRKSEEAISKKTKKNTSLMLSNKQATSWVTWITLENHLKGLFGEERNPKEEIEVQEEKVTRIARKGKLCGFQKFWPKISYLTPSATSCSISSISSIALLTQKKSFYTSANGMN